MDEMACIAHDVVFLLQQIANFNASVVDGFA